MTRLSLIVVLSVLSAATPALAQNRRSFVQDENNSGLYVGGSWGQFDLALGGIDELGDGFSEVAKSEDNIWKAFAGYRFNSYAAVEAAYVSFGGNPGPDEGAASSGYIPSVVLTIPDGGWEVFSRLGYCLYGDASDFMYGVGFGYTFSRRYHLSFDYQIIGVPGADKDALWINGALRF